ncbi:hypothetical protein [Sphingomonas sp. CROZ-RG-20F-R02-07]|uniref:hypothetical protein n=1 Tax=Sphingomonas sp. CROZ-RG-20F-R02-07 TaxID=2914832 RepID=UPI001F592845|nr:hypothetical protein [Sphingomonas sp. CROZ-RG-20F-R02-07]
MSGYGFGKKPARTPDPATDGGRLDLSGITRTPLPVDPAREAAALERGAALGFVDRGAGEGPEPSVRRRRQAVPQSSVYIKGPKDTLDWFIEYTNARAHRSYWQTLEEFRTMVEGKD